MNSTIKEKFLIELNILKVESSYLRFKRNDKNFKSVHLFKLNRKKIAKTKTMLFLLRCKKV